MQAASGPGGADYVYPGVTTAAYGAGDTGYSLVTPTGAGRASLPVVYFIHGFGSIDTSPYAAFIEQLVRKGAIVIYPNYQLTTATAVGSYTPNAITAIQSALQQIISNGGVVADTRRVIAIGHSLGGGIAANIAAIAGSQGIPPPRALMVMSPAQQSALAGIPIPVEDYAQIPAGTLILSIFAAQDLNVTDALAKQLFYGSTNVPLKDKDYIVVNGDAHGPQPLVADHFSPLATSGGSASLFPPDALDFYGYWKLADALMSAAFTGAYRDVALGDGAPAQVFMGYWGDGQPVQPLTVTDTP